MSQSNNILLALGSSFKDYLKEKKTPPVLIEYYEQPLIDIESRKDISYARVSFSENTEDVTDYISSQIANMSIQLYTVQVSVVRAYSKDNHARGEFQVNNIRDILIDWAKQTNYSNITNAYIYTFGYAGSSAYNRNERFVTRTFTFSSMRDLHKPQTG